MRSPALVVVSFGTSYSNALCSIEATESYLASQFPTCDFFRAFTSRKIIAKLKEQIGLTVPTPVELLKHLHEEGYHEVYIQPLHFMHGFEYEKLCQQVGTFQTQFDQLVIGMPLLDCCEDYFRCAETVIANLPACNAQEGIVWMGHGSEHYANASYCQLENTFRSIGYEGVYLGTVEGFPDLDYVIDRLKKRGIQKVTLAPFMLVAGDHAQQDMAGDSPDSWKSRLLAKGFTVKTQLCGLGSLPGIQQVFADHLKKAIDAKKELSN